MKKIGQQDLNWPMGKPWGIKKKTTRNLTTASYNFHGIVHTFYGHVRISVYSGPNHKVTGLDIIMNGKQYHRLFKGKAYSWRFCVTLADRFSKDIAKAQVPLDSVILNFIRELPELPPWVPHKLNKAQCCALNAYRRKIQCKVENLVRKQKARK